MTSTTSATAGATSGASWSDEPPTPTELAAYLRDKGIAPTAQSGTTAFKRRLDRSHEWHHPAYDQGYVKYLEDGAKNEELTLRWNLQHNSVDSERPAERLHEVRDATAR